MKRLILIDSHAIIHRAYHALPPLTSPSSGPVGAVYGFTSIFLRILKELKPDYIAAALDLPGPTFRHVAYERYKAQRPETPSDLAGQFFIVEEVLRAFGIPVYKKEGYEADDIIGTLVKKLGKKKGLETIIVTGDLDTLQLVQKNVKVYAMKKGISDIVIYDEGAVRERYGIRPDQLVDFKGLRGDPSDNIPGVRGIGEKTALDLVKSFGSIEGIYKNIASQKKIKIRDSLLTKLKEGEDSARLSRELAIINTSVPVILSLADVAYTFRNQEKIKSLFSSLGFFSLIQRLDEIMSLRDRVGVQSALVSVEEKETTIEILDSDNKLRTFFHKNKPINCGVAFIQDEIYIAVSGLKSVFKIGGDFYKKTAVKDFFEKNSLVVFDGKSVRKFLKKYGLNLATPIFDLMLAAYLTSFSGRVFSYSAIVARSLGQAISSDPCGDLIDFWGVAELLKSKISQEKLDFVLYSIELPLEKVLVDMEERGIWIDKKFLKDLGDHVDKKLIGLRQDIYKISGESFNINSSQQLSKILFEKLGLRTLGLRKTDKGGVVSTRESELEKLRDAHPVIDRILEHRELTKLKTTYIDVLPKLCSKETGRLHTTFNQVATATGRLSSLNPNLQNIPVMSEYGRQIRHAFVPEKGFLLVSFDYSQIELRIAAHLSDDKKMIEAFRSGVDIHAMTAAEINNIPLDRVTLNLRRAAKILNFGILYGMGSQALAESAGMSRDEAKKFIDEYFHDFSGIRKYIDDTKKLAEEQGFVETLFGRRRYIPEISSPNWQLRREAERMAVNMPIQGTATGDIIKMAMIKVDEWIRKDVPAGRASPNEVGREGLVDHVRLLLQVHDELLFEIKKDFVEKYIPEIKKIMEDIVKLKVPLVVDVKIGRNWGEVVSF